MKKAKKILAVLLVLCMAVALFACGGGGGGGASSPPPANTGSGGGGGEASGGGGGGGESSGNGPAELGFFDRDYDYTQHKAFRVMYLVSATGVMYDSFHNAFDTWSKRININYGGMWAPAEPSNENFLSGVETHAEMGYDGLILDTDPNLAARIDEICRENGVLWMMGMAQARDYSQPYTIMGEYSIGPLLAPNVGFNNIAVGRETTQGLLDWKDKNHPDIPYDQVGFISIGLSLSPQLNERTLGAKQVWVEKNPTFGEYSPDPTNLPKNFFIADTASGTFDQQTATNLVTQIMSNPPAGVKLWLVNAAIWDFAAGAAVVAENLNMIDNVCITTFGAGANAIALWDSGVPTSIRLALETASPVFAESIINALWAMMAGFATPDTLWPEWAVVWDKGDKYSLTSDLDPIYQVPMVEVGADGKPVILEEHGFASMILPMIWVDPDNYVDFYGWVDLYDLGPNAAEADRTYPQFPLGTDLNKYIARGTVPDYYTQYPGQ